MSVGVFITFPSVIPLLWTPIVILFFATFSKCLSLSSSSSVDDST